MVIYKDFFAFYGEVRAKACEYGSFGLFVSFFKPNVRVAGKVKGWKVPQTSDTFSNTLIS